MLHAEPFGQRQPRAVAPIVAEGHARSRPEGDGPRYQLYGLTLRSDFHFRNRLAAADTPPNVTFRCSVGTLDEPSVDAKIWSSHSTAPRAPEVLYWKRDGCPVLRFHDVSTFALFDDRIECTIARSSDAYLVEIQLLGVVLALWLERRGNPVLHASAVEIAGRTAAFLGASGAGKTSLAATFLQRGAVLVTEDLLALQPEPATVWCCAGYPQMRMWPETVQHFAPHATGLELVNPAYTKLRLLVGSDGLGSFSPQSRALSGLYILQRRSDDRDPSIRIERVRPRDAIIELIRYSYDPELVAVMKLHRERLAVLAGIASRIPLWRLSYPGGLAHLSEVCDAVMHNLATPPV